MHLLQSSLVEREREREAQQHMTAAGNVVFAASANLVQSVAKILRDPPFESLKYDVRSLHVA